MIQQSTTSRDTWLTLANTYARLSCGHIKQIKDQLKTAIKESRTITEYMHFIKYQADQLAALGKSLDHKDFIDRILDGLDEDYKSIANIVQGHDTSILFDELHEKLINRELALKHSQFGPSSFPVIANMAFRRPIGGPRPSHSRSIGVHHASGPSTSPRALQPTSSQCQSRPYLGKCQGYLAVGHSVS